MAYMYDNASVRPRHYKTARVSPISDGKPPSSCALDVWVRT